MLGLRHIESTTPRVEAQVDMSRALGASENPPVERIDWHLEVDSNAAPETLEAIKQTADYRCPGPWCIRNPVDLHTTWPSHRRPDLHPPENETPWHSSRS